MKQNDFFYVFNIDGSSNIKGFFSRSSGRSIKAEYGKHTFENNFPVVERKFLINDFGCY